MSQFIHINARIITVLFFVCFTSFGQQKTGNIVQYFGKEKVNDIKEGELLHVFNKGLALKIQNFTFNSSSFPKDPVFDKFLMNPDIKVSEGQNFDIDYQGKELQWKTIKTDTTNSFNNPALRSSYVYLSYKSNVSKTVIFEASGHSLLLINGLPHEGDHYDFGWNLIPVKLKKGLNTFVLKVGRFPRVRARLIEPQFDVQLTTRDLTMPDILLEEQKNYLGGIRVINASEKWVKNYTINSNLKGNSLVSRIINIPPMSVYKAPFSIASVSRDSELGAVDLKVELKNEHKDIVDSKNIKLQIRTKHKHHKRTIRSNIDGSVQYYSVAPSSSKVLTESALFLSVHGASVEATNQANAYKQKDWGNLVAPTNRRPFGFAWEDWGRLDALEVLADAKAIFKPNSKKIYLTGHSMGGHGTWYLGATYPDYFAAIAPCAGYPDLLLYRNSFLNRRLKMPQEQLTRFGLTPKVIERLTRKPVLTPVEKLIKRAGTPSRTLKLKRNYLHHGVYILHGEKDNVVPTFIAQDMRERLGKFHPDFTYYEYPEGTHWYGNHSVDWDPIFNFFKQRTIKEDKDVKTLEFYTGSPGVSSKSHFITIHQQLIPFEVSSFHFTKEKAFKVETKNVGLLEIDLSKLPYAIDDIEIDGEHLKISDSENKVFFKYENKTWKLTHKPSLEEKGPHRSGGFKDAFTNNVVLVYATKGSDFENEWNYNRARFDAETFWYRANGAIEIVKDVDFSLKKYADRNVVLYGNKETNAAWKTLLNDCPIQVKHNEVNFNGKKLKGGQWGMYFIVPRKDSNTASIGVVTASGKKGMKASYMNHYLVNGTTFPDVLLFDDSVLENGTSAVKCAGFFGNDWSVENGDFEWK